MKAAARAGPSAAGIVRVPRSGASDAYHRLFFGLKTRAELWQLLSDFTATGMDLGVAVETAAQIYRDRRKSSVSHICGQMRQSLAAGTGLQPVLRRFVPEGDRLMFAGEGAIEVSAMFGAVARIARGQIAIRRAVRSALAGPVIAAIALLGLYYLLGSRMFPAFREVAPPENWPGFARFIAVIAEFVSGNIWLMSAGFIGAAAGMVVSARYWTGFGREWADRIPPWSFYRLQTGLLFLLLLVESGKQGRNLNTAFLLDIATRSGPYAASRIAAIARLSGSDPSGIGAAAQRTGHGWPAPVLNTALAAYSRQDNWLDNFSRYLDRWMEDLDEAAKAAAAFANYGLLLLVALSIGGALSTVFTLIGQVQRTF